MKIAFWSNVHGQSATTSNALAVAIMGALMNQSRVALLQSHFTLNNLDNALVGDYAEDLNSFNDIGIDALIRDIKSAPLSEETVLNDCISLMNRQLSLYPCTRKSNRDTYEKDMLNIFNRVMDGVEAYHQDTYIDTASGFNPLTRKILDNSDLVVVNLSQNQRMVQEYIDSDPLGGKKVIYLIGNYNCNSRYNLRNLNRRHPTMKGRTAAVPYCVDYLDAQGEGETIKFMLKNYECGADDKNHFFIQSVKQAAALINSLRGEEKSWRP